MATFDITGVVQALHDARHNWRQTQSRNSEAGNREFPSRDALSSIIDCLKGVLFPMRLGPPDLRQESEDFHVAHALDAALHALLHQVKRELAYNANLRGEAGRPVQEEALIAVRSFAAALPAIRTLLDSDVLAAYQGDPAARSVDEVLLCYPGVLAMIHYRIAHHLYGLGLPLLARIISELAHSATGIDIHPGATIGAGFFIDHGTGVVIGETAVIGERVRVYQAVTLGAKRFPTDAEGHLQKGLPRHPVVEDDVVIYAGATILGRITLGKGAVIGGNVWLTHDVPAGGRVAQAESREGAFANGIGAA
ncbi:serine O-acetyltransferase [Duganella sp. CF402]|uniref:serine O-acetyltransferase EpsC n=1 Tax=unclassified Duganella TaxID=2636909 RepID=UPI0008AE6849|nr:MULTISPECIES: serine O-acetyltransferase EpsC [unclassified Duganella]RZT05431.1 serine O-acetyltransferase [Duganella sp. BK701]SEN04352.1 serine O-acetyltransferase [Duganella sp. CF402]